MIRFDFKDNIRDNHFHWRYQFSGIDMDDTCVNLRNNFRNYILTKRELKPIRRELLNNFIFYGLLHYQKNIKVYTSIAFDKAFIITKNGKYTEVVDDLINIDDHINTRSYYRYSFTFDSISKFISELGSTWDDMNFNEDIGIIRPLPEPVPDDEVVCNSN